MQKILKVAVMATMMILTANTASASIYLPDGVGQLGFYGRTPGGIVDLRTGEIVDEKFTTEMEAIMRYFPEVFDEAIVIFDCESNLQHYRKGKVIRGPDGHDIGIAQIRSIVWEKKAQSFGQDIYTLSGNLGFARWLYDQYGWKPWVCKKELTKTSRNLSLASSQR